MRSRNHSIRCALIISMAMAVVIATAASAASAAAAYTVREGDSLFLIARRFGTTSNSIRSANGLAGDWIYPGQALYIPNASPGQTQPPTGSTGPSVPPSQSSTTYVVREGDSLYLISQRHGVSIDAIRAASGLAGDWIYPGQVLRIPSQSASRPPSSPTVPSQPSNDRYSASDTYLLAQLVTAEAGGEPYEGQVAVAATVLNRTRSGQYPASVSGVVFQVVDGRYYQYSPVLDGRIRNTPSASAQRAVRDAMNGSDPSYGALGFYNPTKTSNYWVRSRTITRVIGEHVFFK
ncbi:MAG: LysM peptidoglycan-binding domain-containing protein [Clostridia bacterium]|nr:LysM peptidoglycan-binding domain-containing protein [Clostridia bacterium]